MRFYADIQNTKSNHIRVICYYPHWVYAVDFIYYIMRGYDLDWTPYPFKRFTHIYDQEELKPGPNVYCPNRLSPFSETVRYAVKNIIQHSDLDYEKVYEKLVPQGAEDKLERYITHVSEITLKLLQKRYITHVEMLVKFTYLGRLTASFYKHGTKDCAHIVPFYITNTLAKITEDFTFSRCFNDVGLAAKSVVDFFRENDDFVINEALYEDEEGTSEKK